VPKTVHVRCRKSRCSLTYRHSARRLLQCHSCVGANALTSGVSATNSIADLRMRSTSPPQRMSIRRFRPTLHPAPSSPCMNAAAEFGHRVVRGQGHQYADAPHPLRLLRACREWPNDREPAIPLMKSRRRIAFPRLRTAPTSVKAASYSRDLRSAKWGSMIICTANNLEPHV
jgi:hypothetical protein